MGSALKKASSVVLPQLGAVGGAVNGLVQGQGLKGALEGGLKSGVMAAADIGGGMLGNALIPGTIGNALGSTASNMVGSSIANTSIGSALGSSAGNAFASSLFPAQQPQQGAGNVAASGPAPFHASQEAPMAAPASLSSLSSLTPNQQTSNIANQGVYGGGQGPQEDAYFLNQINRRLVDSSGHVASDLSGVNPIENSFLAKLGLGGQSNPTSLLQAISKWQAP